MQTYQELPKRMRFEHGKGFTQKIYAGLIDHQTRFGIKTPTFSRTPKKHGNRQANGGGQVSHTESLTENIRNG